jgi:hypothetical protein
MEKKSTDLSIGFDANSQGVFLGVDGGRLAVEMVRFFMLA